MVTTSYPGGDERASGISPGLPVSGTTNQAVIAACPVHALDNGGVRRNRCIDCYRCARTQGENMAWDRGFEWAQVKKEAVLPAPFKHAVNIRVLDAGDCGACLSEIEQLNNPYYNMHRLGFFITPTPRKADILIVAGTITKQMRPVLMKTWEAMPTPKRLIAVGACALTHGVFGQDSPVLSDILPVDVAIPGCPPPPLAIIHGLLAITGRKPGSDWEVE